MQFPEVNPVQMKKSRSSQISWMYLFSCIFFSSFYNSQTVRLIPQQMALLGFFLPPYPVAQIQTHVGRVATWSGTFSGMLFMEKFLTNNLRTFDCRVIEVNLSIRRKGIVVICKECDCIDDTFLILSLWKLKKKI